MNCYYHENITSVGICRNCLKGLCKSCAVEIDGGLACPGKCEEAARKTVEYLRTSMASAESYRKIYANSSSFSLIYPSFLLLTGLIYLLMPWYYQESNGEWMYLLGAVFILVGVSLIYRALKLKPAIKNLSQSKHN